MSDSTAKGILETAVVVVSLVHTLMDSFGSAADLYKRLKRREDRDSDRRHRGGRHRPSDGDDEDSEEEALRHSPTLVWKEYDRGYQQLGNRYAVGDLIAQNQLQAYIIHFQQVIISIFQQTALDCGPSRPNPISHHLAKLLTASHSAQVGTIEALTQQYQRMLASYEASNPAAPVPNLPVRSLPHAHLHSRDSAVSALSDHSSLDGDRQPRRLHCPYAIDLQNHPNQPLADSLQEDGDGCCPYCDVHISTTPGRIWEISKDTEERERVFHIQNRFIVKCHRQSHGFGCVLCSRDPDRTADAVCESVKGLVNHIWRDHTCEEYALEADIKETP